MKKKTIILILCIVLIVLLLAFFLFSKEKEEPTQNAVNYYNFFSQEEPKDIIENTTIQGIVELNHNGYIYLFNGQHFIEYGFEMDEYNRVNIFNKNQECIDYHTGEQYNIDSIGEGDILICTGDLIEYDSMKDDDFDTKDNPIIVLKADDYNEMKKEVLNNKEEIATIGDYHVTTGKIYIRYELSDKEYSFPFVLEFDITEDIQIVGKLEKGKKVNVQYKDLNVPLDELEIKSIEIVE